MASILRFFKIIHTIGRHRLDKLAPQKNVPLTLKLTLFFFRLYPTNHNTRGRSLRLACESLGPIFVKFGQLLSTRPDLLPSDIVDELNQLQDNVKPFDSAQSRAIIEEALGHSTDTLFKGFESTPLASASVAQVHAAVLQNDEKVVIKVIRPDIDKVIEKDLRLLTLLATILETLHTESRRLKLLEVIEDYRLTIFDELDLLHEAANATQLKRNFASSKMLYIPKIYWEYTRKNVMVMERIDGITVTDIPTLKSHHIDMQVLAERGVEIFFTQVFEHNFFHADMHPGNVFVSRGTPKSPQYLAVDFAIVGSLTREDQYYLARNLLAMFRRDYKQVAELHVLSAWVPKNTSINGFESAIRTVCEPIFEKPLKDISFGQALVTLFRTARRFNMPIQPQLVLLQKTLLNIEGLGKQLYPELNLWDTAHPYLEKWIRDRFHPKTLLKDFKYYSPEWIEKFPQVPHLFFDTLKEVKALAEKAPERQKTCGNIGGESKCRPRSRKRLIITGIPIAGFLWSIWPIAHAFPPAAIVFGTFSIAMLLWY